MKVAFYDTKPYDRIWFDPLLSEYGYQAKFFDYKLTADTAVLAKGCDAVCVFVNDEVDAAVIDALCSNGVGLIALRCSGYNNVDLAAARDKIRVVRVPRYSPDAVAEYAMALLLTVNRKTHRAYVRTRDNNFNINGLLGMDLAGKTAGVIGTGQIGSLFADICNGFKMRVLGYDIYPSDQFPYEYVSLQDLFARSDIISLHCPLTPQTRHIINADSIQQMKDHCFIINTSRGALIDTTALIEGLKSKKFPAPGWTFMKKKANIFSKTFPMTLSRTTSWPACWGFPM